ncbi:Trypsin [Methylobacterium sp. 190mf]|uniref:serine protease n=1 Tax=Methylobacterium sp. 190mf TaxID=1761798 RepID=UPI00089E43B1|nr:serine protease [Methylobacterium sp. 190mf]SEG71595.1 Trypsin [Methylobacterium sp. 190mf]
MRGFSRFLVAAIGICSLPSSAYAQVSPFQKGVGKILSDKQILDIDKNLSSIVRQNAPESTAAANQLGSREFRLDPRIVGGEPADIKDNPWQVALIFGHAPEPVRVQFCGGSLIGSKIVVTAAHCVDRGTKIERVNVIANTSFYKNGGERAKVSKIVVHENWNPQTHENDVAVLHLEADIKEAKPIILADRDIKIADGSNLRVTGWGAISEGAQGSEILLTADIPTVSNATCKEAYGNDIKSGMLCAGLRNGGLDSCQGDSGGPGVVLNGGKPTLAAIVSFGEGCARREKYGVYTRVSQYRDWIEKASK